MYSVICHLLLKSAGDFELWTRFYKHADLYAVDEPIGIFRTHEGQVSVAFAETREKRIALQRTGGMRSVLR